MSLLETILKRIPEARQSEFLRAVHELNVSSDSPDLVQAYLAVEALTPVLDEVRRASVDIPNGMKAAGAEIVRGLARDVASESVAAVQSAVTTYIATAAQHASDAITSAHSGLSQSIGSLTVAASKAVTAHGAATDALFQSGQNLHHQVRNLVRFSWYRLAVHALALVAAFGVGLWSGSTYAHGRSYAAGYADRVRPGSVR